MSRTKHATAGAKGFTLIELILVVVIIGVVTAIAVPAFVRSLQGNRLRAAARTVAACGRYARSMAVLHQRPFVVQFAREGHRIVVEQEGSSGPQEEDALRAPGPGPGEGPSGGGGPATGAIAAGGPLGIERRLDAVRITHVEMDRPVSDVRGDGAMFRVTYASNGRCEPYRVELADENDGRLEVHVDMLGTAEIRQP